MLILFIVIFASIAAGQSGICGDANGDFQANIGDVVYIISFVFTGGPPPQFMCDGDVNGDGDVNVGDAVHLVNWIFRGGPPPVCMPGGGVADAFGCKLFGDDKSSDQTCIEYQYDGQGFLSLTHINAGFNCCPGEIVVDIDVAGNTIIISEMETEPLCYCLCLFDLDIEVHFLDPGEYTIEVNELYVDPGDEPLTFTVNLTESTSGSYCVARDNYPWGQSASPSGDLIHNTTCLDFGHDGGRLGPLQSDDCVEYSYDGEDVLSIEHRNAAFNCCPQQLLADFSFGENTITITEGEIADPPCDCLCLYDVSYQITGLPPGVFVLRIEGMYLGENDEALEVTIDLNANPGGSHCVTREGYPWNDGM